MGDSQRGVASGNPIVATAVLNKLVDAYRARTPGSARLATEAAGLFPGGVTHDGRLLDPYPIFVERAAGSRKWDVDGHEYVDYAGGHGALLLGHGHPAVVQAITRQAPLGTHFGACHALEVQWGRLVRELMPAAERVRFTSSGTEATLMALRLARAFTGRQKVLRFLGHFHGWHDHAAFGVASHFDGAPTPGVLADLARQIVLAPANDIDATRRLLVEQGDVAAIIIEPTGASWGQIPVTPQFLHDLRSLTAETKSLLIFDEVVTGFRVAPGGAQGRFGIAPDLTTLAKILAGGMPGGAVVGRRDVLDLLDPHAATAAGREKIPHQGTFNANPVSAAAGIAALTIVRDSDVCERASSYAARLREALAVVVREQNVPWVVYGTFSGFHIFTNPQGLDVSAAEIEAGRVDHRTLKATNKNLLHRLRLGMLLHGVDLFSWPGGPTSAVHSADDLERTVEAFRRTLRMLKEEGDL